MCGIAGAIWRNGPPDEAALRRAAAMLSHRGPNDSGVYLADAVGLVHTRLPIIDLDGGHQPILDPPGDLALVVNGEVYNFVELRQELEAAGRRFVTGSDSETILHLYATGGVREFSRLHGMFACALYDRSSGSLVLARDRLGIKPLYYACLPDRVAFASELKGLLPLLPARPDLSAEAIDRFLETGFNAGEETIFRGIRRLAPGTALTIGRDLRTRPFAYWSLADVRPRRLGLGEALEEFEALFAQVLEEHRRADVPYGLFLSGGLDSGTLLARLSRGLDAPIRTFSVGFAGAPPDELDAARAVARMYGSEHTELRLTSEALMGALPLMVWAADDPIHDLACLPTALLAQEAARGLRVVFTGEGGDEGFAGYGRYRRHPLQHFIKAIADPLGGGHRSASHWAPALRRLAFGEALRAARANRREPLRLARAEMPAGWSYLRQAQYLDLRTELLDGLLVKVDRMLMAFGLEGRVPYLDHRIVELGLSLPDDLKVRGRTGKVLLRHWARDNLPPGHLEQRKRGFGVPLAAGLSGERLTRIGARLAANPMIREWFRPGTPEALVAIQRKTGGATRPLMQLLHLAIWHRLFVAGPTQRPGLDQDPLDWIA